MTEMTNILTIDVEDYFMVSAFSDIVKANEWENYKSRIENNTIRSLDILDQYHMKGTFFVLGWVGERYPHLIKEIDQRGHEIACHSYQHKLVYQMTSEEFKRDTLKAKSILEDTIGKRVIGYRAPSYSITGKSLWALGILREVGFSYDSSIFPIMHDRYGFPGFSRFPVDFDTESGKILEIPLSTVRVLGRNIPACGGGYLRFFPLSFTKWVIRKLHEKEQTPAIVYFHPWEIDPGQPRMKGTWISNLRHYWNIDLTEKRIHCLLERFKFGSIREVFGDRIRSMQEDSGMADDGYGLEVIDWR